MRARNKAAILRMFQDEQEMPPADQEHLWVAPDSINPLPRGISAIEEVADNARALYGEGLEPAELRPFEICAKLPDVNPNSIRRDIRELVASGLLAVEEHRYRLSGNATYDDAEAHEFGSWVSWVQEAARACDWDKVRLIDQDALIVRHSANRGKSRSMPMAPRRRGASGDAGRPFQGLDHGGRELRLSSDPQLARDIAVIATPMSSLEILDIDAKRLPSGPAGSIDLLLAPPPGCFAYQSTPHGFHFYRRWGWGPSVYQDWNFVAASRERENLWHERLFDDDGEPRTPPQPIPGRAIKEKDKAFCRWLWRLWRFFQMDAAARGYGRPPRAVQREREPGEEG